MSTSSSRPAKGFFITLYDEDSLSLCLSEGVYGQYMSPEHGIPETYHHYRALADYASARAGDHVFFFHKRRIYYGGQLQGDSEHGAFYLNGQYSPLGRAADAPLVWNEATRSGYTSTKQTGIFEVETRDSTRRVCQPYLFQFSDPNGFAGSYISSDDLYLELSEYPYPLPSNTISGMAFCTLTPGETTHLLSLLSDDARGQYEFQSGEISMSGSPPAYHPQHDIGDLTETSSEAHLEAALLAQPQFLLPSFIDQSAALCRQVPVSPYKPDPDRADICLYTAAAAHDQTVPTTVLELKHSRAGKQAALQVVRYLDWLHTRFDSIATEIDVAMVAPSFTSTFESYIPESHQDQLIQHAYDPR